MRTPVLAIAFLLLIGLTAADDSTPIPPHKSDRNRFPASFASVEEAAECARQFLAGGHVELISVKAERFLVLFQHGSGLPVIGIGLYRWEDKRWRHVTDSRPPKLPAEFLRAQEAGGAIYLVGEKSGARWRFYPAD